MSADPSRPVTRAEVALLVALAVGAHGLLAVGVARARSDEPVVRAQQVTIEVVPPAPPPSADQAPVVPEQAARAERPRPVTRRAAPRPQLVASNTDSSRPSEEPPALPIGDDPALAAESGSGPATVAAPAASAPAAPPAPAPAIEAHEGANYLKNPRPAYPAMAQRRGWEGEVLLRVRVAPDGRAAGAVVQRSSGHELLDQAAVDAVRSWLFVPARQEGVAVAGFVSVPITFRLQ